MGQSSRENLLTIPFKQGGRKERRARGADRSKRAPTTLGQQIYPRNEGHPRHFSGISWAMPLTVI